MDKTLECLDCMFRVITLFRRLTLPFPSLFLVIWQVVAIWEHFESMEGIKAPVLQFLCNMSIKLSSCFIRSNSYTASVVPGFGQSDHDYKIRAFPLLLCLRLRKQTAKVTTFTHVPAQPRSFSKAAVC